MATIKTVLDKRRIKEDGTYPLGVRITHQTKSTFLALQISLPLKYWDTKKQCVKSSHPNAKLLNLNISKKLIEIQEVILKLEQKSIPYTAQKIKKECTNPFISKDFTSFTKEQIES